MTSEKILENGSISESKSVRYLTVRGTMKTTNVLMALSGGALNTFFGMHMLNLISRVFGANSYDGLQDAMRMVYQNPIVEVGLGGALVVHLVVGAVNIFSRWQRPANKSGKPAAVPVRVQLHRLTGYIVTMFLGGHILATRGHSLLFGEQLSGSQIVEFSLKEFPGMMVMLPYYLLFSAAGLYHSLYGAVRASDFLMPANLRPKFLSGPLFEPLAAGIILSAWCGVFAFAGFYGSSAPTTDYPMLRAHYEHFVPSFAHSFLPWK